MSKDMKPIYAPLPARAMVDSRLKERHLRTLLVVSAHDRLGKNGIGCYASHKRLTEMVGCDYSRLSTNLRELAEFGYIEGKRHPLNKRLRVYKVIYTQQDAAAMEGVKNDRPALDTLRSSKQSAADSLPDGKEFPPDSLPNGNEIAPDSLPTEMPNPAENCAKPDVNIFSETGNTSYRSKEIHSTEVASVEADAACNGEFLRKLERILNYTPTEQWQQDTLNNFSDRLETIIDEHPEYDDPIGNWANRLHGDVEMMLDDAGTRH